MAKTKFFSYVNIEAGGQIGYFNFDILKFKKLIVSLIGHKQKKGIYMLIHFFFVSSCPYYQVEFLYIKRTVLTNRNNIAKNIKQVPHCTGFSVNKKENHRKPV